ncbi:MAG: hypothetical protein RJA87_748 [Pseudomonadota bacterium]|jgi:hypothetical protein
MNADLAIFLAIIATIRTLATMTGLLSFRPGPPNIKFP